MAWLHTNIRPLTSTNDQALMCWPESSMVCMFGTLSVRWWWRINTIALWCDENMIGTIRNLCEHVRSNTTMRSLRIVLQRTESQQTGGESQCECTTNQYECTMMRYEPVGTDMNWYDIRRCNTTQYELASIRKANTNVLNISKHLYWPPN